MKLYIVCLLVALACVAVTPAPAPQLNAQVSASTFGPLTTLYDLAFAFPSAMISTAHNAIHGIPFVNMFPAALQTGIDVGKNFAQGMDYTLLGLAGGRGGSNPFPQGSLSGGGQNIGGQVGGQLAGGLNGFSNFVNNLNPLNALNGIAQQNGQQVNPFGVVGNALNNLNPLNYLQGAASQAPGEYSSNVNNPLATLSNGAAQALSQLNPAVIAQYLNSLQQNAQTPNSASNVAANSILNGGSPVPTASLGKVRAQDKEIPKVESSPPA